MVHKCKLCERNRSYHLCHLDMCRRLFVSKLSDVREVQIWLLNNNTNKKTVEANPNYRDDSRIARLEMSSSHGDVGVAVASHVQRELDGAIRAELVACAILVRHILRILSLKLIFQCECDNIANPWVLHFVDHLLGVKRYEADAMGEKLVEEHGGVGIYLHPIDCCSIRNRKIRIKQNDQIAFHTDKFVYSFAYP